MLLSRFVVVYRDVRPDEHVLYDVIGDAYAGVDNAVLQAIERWREAPPQDENESAWASSLSELGFVVESSAEDAARFQASLEQTTEGLPETLVVTLMPTLACNLACTYCFQKDHPAAGRMSVRTEEAAIAWILRKIDGSKLSRLLVQYMGGEPLTRRDFVLRTAEDFSREMAKRGGKFEWELITNGVELDVSFARKLRALGEGAIKVTLDGDQETHDVGRVHRNGNGTFDQVFANFVEVAKSCRDIAMRVGGNFRPGEHGSYDRLLAKLRLAGLAGLIDEMSFKPIIDTDAELRGTCAGNCAAPTGEADTLVQIGQSLERHQIARKTLAEADKAGVCGLHWKHVFAIDPEGRIYKCVSVAGRPEMAIGSVLEPGERAEPLTAAAPWQSNAACQACAFLPVCLGGCLGGRYLQIGRTGSVLCRYDQYDKTFRQEVKKRYLTEFREEEDSRAAV